MWGCRYDRPSIIGLANPLGLEGRVVIVTGADGGLGRAFAEGFAAAGAKVVVADVALAGADETVAAIKAKSGAAMAVRADVTNASSLDALAAGTVEAFGAIDVLGSNRDSSRESPACFPPASRALKH